MEISDHPVKTFLHSPASRRQIDVFRASRPGFSGSFPTQNDGPLNWKYTAISPRATFGSVYEKRLGACEGTVFIKGSLKKRPVIIKNSRPAPRGYSMLFIALPAEHSGAGKRENGGAETGFSIMSKRPNLAGNSCK